MVVQRCFLDLSDVSGGRVGGQLTTNTMDSRNVLGDKTDRLARRRWHDCPHTTALSLSGDRQIQRDRQHRRSSELHLLETMNALLLAGRSNTSELDRLQRMSLTGRTQDLPRQASVVLRKAGHESIQQHLDRKHREVTAPRQPSTPDHAAGGRRPARGAPAALAGTPYGYWSVAKNIPPLTVAKNVKQPPPGKLKP